MTIYILRRLVNALFVLFIVCLVTFLLLHSAPGGLSILMQPDLDPADAERIRHNLGLDQPVFVQFANWLSGVVRGDFGLSLVYRRPVLEMIVERLPNTTYLAVVALALTICVGIPLGILSARRHYSAFDQIATFISFVGVAVPDFWLAIMLIFVFSVTLNLLPSAGMATLDGPFSWGDRLSHLVLPATVLSAANLAQITRYTRSSMLEVLHQDYVRTARAKGVAERHVLLGHAFRNALIPVVTVIGLQLPRLVSGAVIVEVVFGWPGMGRLAVDAAFHRDYPTVMGLTVMVSVAVILSNLFVDVLYAYLDPRIRLE